MEEDSDAKIRRNLVVASTLILLVAWLELPLASLAEKVLAAPPTVQLRPFKVWLACLAVLLYMALRYRFTKEWNLFGRLFRENTRKKRDQMIVELIERAFRLFNNERSDSIIFTKSLSSVCEELTAAQKLLGRQLGDQPFHVRFHQRTVERDPWHGEVSYFLEHPTADPKISAGTRTVSYAIEGLKKWYITFTSHTQSVLYSESSVRFIVPCALAAAAFVTVIWNMYRAW